MAHGGPKLQAVKRGDGHTIHETWLSPDAWACGVDEKSPQVAVRGAPFSHLVYSDRPIPISHSKGDWPPQAYQHPLFYEPLDPQKGDSFREMGTDSGYGATQGLLVKKSPHRLTVFP